jgi:predicted flap endonuclease-1-like 5' DNA nuclease
MDTILSTILITAPLAFIVGWVVCKSVFNQLRQNRSTSVINTAEIKTATSQPNQPVATQDAAAIGALSKQLTASMTASDALRNEVQLLKEAVAEREHRLRELSFRLAETATPPEETATDVDTIRNIKIGKEMREQQQRIADNQHDLARLTRELIAAENRLDGAGSRFKLWRNRVKPIVRRVRQQRMIISELREELRQRDRENEGERENADMAPATALTTQPATPPPVEVQLPADNLRVVRGIGPAMQKKLNEQGVYRLQQLADFDHEELQKISRQLGLSEKQLRKNTWIRQARELLGQPINDDTTAAQAEAVSA